jgi:hypothetical protein
LRLRCGQHELGQGACTRARERPRRANLERQAKTLNVAPRSCTQVHTWALRGATFRVVACFSSFAEGARKKNSQIVHKVSNELDAVKWQGHCWITRPTMLRRGNGAKGARGTQHGTTQHSQAGSSGARPRRGQHHRLLAHKRSGKVAQFCFQGSFPAAQSCAPTPLNLLRSPSTR